MRGRKGEMREKGRRGYGWVTGKERKWGVGPLVYEK